MDNADTNRSTTPEEQGKTASTAARQGKKPRYTDTTKATKARTDLTKRYDLAIIERHAAAGLNDIQWQIELQVSDRTWRKLKQREDIQNAMKRGEANPIQHVEASLFKKATGFWVMENGKEKYFAPDSLAIMYFLNNKAPDQYKHSSHVETNLKQTIAFPEFDSLPIEQKKKVLVLLERKEKGEDIQTALRELKVEIATIRPEQRQ